MARNLAICLGMLVAAASGTACGVVVGYRGAAVDGRVIDAKTREPLPGVIVVARWNLEGLLHGEDFGNLQLEETVTAADGSYRFAAWGPRRGRLFARHDPRAPWLYFFKPGYALRVLVNDEFAPGAMSDPRTSRWNGAVVELREPADPHIEARVTSGAFRTMLMEGGGCAWQQVPRLTVAALRHPDAEVRAAMPSLAWLWLGEPSFETIESLERNPERHKRCADPRVVLKEFL